MPELLRVRSDQGSAQLIQVQFQPVYPKLYLFVVRTLIMSGFGLFLYWALKFAYFIVTNISE